MNLRNVAEEIAASGLTATQKANVLLAIGKAMRDEAHHYEIRSIGDVDWLALHDPDEFERLRRSFWILYGQRSRTAAEALDDAGRGAKPALRQLYNAAVVAAYPVARALIEDELRRRASNGDRVARAAAGILATELAREKAAV